MPQYEVKGCSSLALCLHSTEVIVPIRVADGSLPFGLPQALNSHHRSG